MKLQSFDKEYTDIVNHDITSYSSTTTRQSISASTDYTPFRSLQLHLSKSNDNINIDDTLLFQSFDNSGIAAIDVADSGNNPLHKEQSSSASTGSQPQRILAGIRKLVSVVTACSSSCSCPLDQDDDAILIHEGTIIEYPAKKSLQRNQSIDDNITDITSVTGIGYGYQRNKYWLNEYGINDVSY